MPDHSDYIVYVDESGDHGLTSIDPQYPVFVLADCIFEKEVYSERIVPAVQGLKFKHFGHDVVLECRGKREDRELELEFRQVCDGRNYQEDRFPFEIVFADKRTNSAGLQLADMVARPIGRHVMNPEQPNRAFELLRPKFYGADVGLVDGRGLKCFP